MQGYRRKFGPENVVELSKNIIVQHEDFLKQDDPDKKADALRYMAGYVAQYLHLVPQESKFTYKETERVLHHSAMNIAVFDPREASLSFRSLAKYAENLIEQPWRTDFHVIKLTSGFYVHNISAQLQNAHEILIVLGYVNIDETTMKLVPKPNLAILKAVSRDCYIASQECLILSQIWQHVADQEPDYPLTIGEVFEYRKNHLGDTDTICNKLLYDIRARMHLVKHQNPQPQQYPYTKNQPVPMIKNSQCFVPIDRLIDFDSEDISNDEPDNIMPQNHSFIPERELEQTQELVKNVNLYNYNQDAEHIYDPVYGGSGDPPSVPHHYQQQYQQQHQRRHSQSQAAIHKAANNLPGQYFYNNNNIRKPLAAPAQPPQQFFNYNPINPINPYQAQQFHNNFNCNGASNNLMPTYKESSDGRNSMSPMIPKTVTSLFSNSNGIQSSQSSGSRNNVSKSNSMNSISGIRSGVGGASSSSSSLTSQTQPPFANQHLIKTKVKESDLDEPPPPPRDKNGYRELSSSSSGGSPALASARNYPKKEGLDSLDTVYYAYLLKKDHTDEVMGNNSVDSRNTHQSQQESKRSSSHHHHTPPIPNNYDPEETHMYDGRRVIPKKNHQPQPHHQQEKPISKRLENDTRRKKQRNPVESVIPPDSKYDASYNDNLSSAVEANKPSHEKEIKRPTDGERRQPVESEIPSTSYSSSPLPPPPAKKEFEPWDCRHCTYKNLIEERICEMCAKSKDFFEEDVPSPQALVIAATTSAQHQQQAQPSYLHTVAVTPKLFSIPNSNYDNPVAHPTAIKSNNAAAIAGPSEPSPPAEDKIECPQCTLLNPRKARLCSACDYRLKKVETPKSLDEVYDDIR